MAFKLLTKFYQRGTKVHRWNHLLLTTNYFLHSRTDEA